MSVCSSQIGFFHCSNTLFGLLGLQEVHGHAQNIVVVLGRSEDERSLAHVGLHAGSLQQFEAVLTALLGAWEEVKACEEARAQLEGQLFKTKTQSTTILTEEARLNPRHCCSVSHGEWVV